MGEIEKSIQDEIIKKRINILKGFLEFEKAKNDGEIHPNGKWYWVSSANKGKGDWRVIKKNLESEKHEDDYENKTDYIKPTDGSETKFKRGRVYKKGEKFYGKVLIYWEGSDDKPTRMDVKYFNSIVPKKYKIKL